MGGATTTRPGPGRVCHCSFSGVMGASHASRTVHTSSVSSGPTSHCSLTLQRDETDTPNTLLPPSRLRGGGARNKKYLLSLDRNMKSFLRTSNLPGLEYRLKLAGYRTFHDLLTADREELEARGFTGIMAQRLVNAVDEYIHRQVYRSEEERLPFRLVRKGQRLQTEPSESMRDNPNYRKPNIKRRKPFTEEPAKKGVQIAHIMHGNPPLTASQQPSHVRLMSKSDLQLQHLLSPPTQEPPISAPVESPSGTESLAPVAVQGGLVTNHQASGLTTSKGDSVAISQASQSPTAVSYAAGGGTGSGEISGAEMLPPEDSIGRRILGIIVNDGDAVSFVLEEPPSIDEPPFADLSSLFSEREAFPEELSLPATLLEEETDFSTDFTSGARITRCFSVPADFELTSTNPTLVPISCAEDHTVAHVRTFSSPATLVTQPSITTHPQTTVTSFDRLLGMLHNNAGTASVSELCHTLHTLLRKARHPQNRVEAADKVALAVIVNVLRKHCRVLAVATVCCQLIQQLCTGITYM